MTRLLLAAALAGAACGPAPAPPAPAATTTTTAPTTTTTTAAPTTTTHTHRVHKRAGRSEGMPGQEVELADIRACESGGRYDAVSRSGKYRGAYQFDRRTWEGVGGSGDPAAASPAEQDARAAELYRQRGAAPWPTCGRRR